MPYPSSFFLAFHSVIAPFLQFATPCELLPPTHMLPLSPPPPRCSLYHHPPLSLLAPHSFFPLHPLLPCFHLPICHVVLCCSSSITQGQYSQVFLSSFVFCNICISAVSAFEHPGNVKIRSVCWSRGSVQPWEISSSGWSTLKSALPNALTCHKMLQRSQMLCRGSRWELYILYIYIYFFSPLDGYVVKIWAIKFMITYTKSSPTPSVLISFLLLVTSSVSFGAPDRYIEIALNITLVQPFEESLCC